MEGLKLALILVLSSISVVHSRAPRPNLGKIELDQKRQKLVHEFETINEYLEKQVKSNKVELIVIEAEKKLRKLGLFRSDSLTEAYKTFVGLPEIVSDEICSPEAVDLFEDFDLGVDDSHLEPNHKLRPIDLVAQYYGYKFINFCPLAQQVKTENIFKENKYQQVDKLIPDSVKESDVETQMAKIQELHKAYERDNVDGSLTDALRNIVSLKQLLNLDTCNSDIAAHIIRKNNLGRRIHYYGARRFADIIDYYVQKHAKLCGSTEGVEFGPTVE